jgi:hypothetical protein
MQPPNWNFKPSPSSLECDQFPRLLERKLTNIERRHAASDLLQFLRKCLGILVLPGDKESE